MPKYLVKRVVVEKASPGPLEFGLYEVTRSMSKPVAVFGHEDHELAHDIATMLNNRASHEAECARIAARGRQVDEHITR